MKTNIFSMLRVAALALLLLAGSGSAYAQITYPTAATTTTPGMPTTGSGGDVVMNMALLASSMILVTIGAVTFRRFSLHK